MRSLSHYTIIVMRSLLFLLIINPPFSLHAMDADNGNQLLQTICIKLDDACRHPAIALAPAIALRLVSNIFQLTQYPSMDNCIMDTRIISANVIYLSLTTIAFVLICKKRG